MRWLVLVLLCACHRAAPQPHAYHRPISCAANDAFDEGLRLFYAFDVEAAEQSFRRAAPECAMGEWGVALALGPNINVPQLADRRAEAKDAIARALALPSTGVERALIEALAVRYSGADATTDDRHYADAMRALHRRYPDDPDVAALTAASLLDLRPFGQWLPDGTPAPETLELVALLEEARARRPDHPGLTHYTIHALEASPHPERALDAARAIGTMMPAQGHLVHMPSHIYLRTGRYAEAAEWNRRAIAADERWQADGRAGPLYQMYVLHNHHFLWTADLWLGNRAEAEHEATLLAGECTPAMLQAMPGMEALLTLPAVTLARFSAWKELVALARVDDKQLFARGVVDALRVQALARLGQLDAADRELGALQHLVDGVPADRSMGANNAHDVLAIALTLARGEVEVARGRRDFSTFRAAVAREDALHYDEPPSWPLPIREILGARLAEAGRVDECRATAAADQLRHPDNRWAAGMCTTGP